jgi:hypothetical protein
MRFAGRDDHSGLQPAPDAAADSAGIRFSLSLQGLGDRWLRGDLGLD